MGPEKAFLCFLSSFQATVCSQMWTSHTPLAQAAFHQLHIHVTAHLKTWHRCFSYSNTNKFLKCKFLFVAPLLQIVQISKVNTHTHTHGNFKEFCQSPANRTAALMKQKRMTRRWILSFPVVPNFFGTRTGFMKDNFSMDRVVREGFRMIQEHYIYCALYYFYISSTSDHQTLDPRGWGPLF